jgi:hypothetical protein
MQSQPGATSIGGMNDPIDTHLGAFARETASCRGGVAISGYVRGGRGKASAELAAHRQEIETITGEKLFPGSLNVILDRPVRFKQSEAALFDSGFRMLWPAEMNGVAVWVYRWRHTALHVAEILCSRKLRDVLHNDNKVIVNIDECHIDDIYWTQGLAWHMIWAGRRHWCYTSDRYYFETLGFCRAMGATQERKTPHAPVVSIQAGYPDQRSMRCERNPTLP